jgi:hypothetical protein
VYLKGNQGFLKVISKDNDKDILIPNAGFDNEFNRLSIHTNKENNYVYVCGGNNRANGWNKIWYQSCLIEEAGFQWILYKEITATNGFHFSVPNIFKKDTTIYLIAQLHENNEKHHFIKMYKDGTKKQEEITIISSENLTEWRDNYLFNELLSYKSSFQEGKLYNLLTEQKMNIPKPTNISTVSYGTSFVKDNIIYHVYTGFHNNGHQEIWLWNSKNNVSLLIDDNTNCTDSFDNTPICYIDIERNIYIAYTYSNGSSLIVKKIMIDNSKFIESKQEILFTQNTSINNHSYPALYGFNNKLYIAYEKAINNLIIEKILNIKTDEVETPIEEPIEEPIENPDGKIEGKIDAKIEVNPVKAIKKNLWQLIKQWLYKTFSSKENL